MQLIFLIKQNKYKFKKFVKFKFKLSFFTPSSHSHTLIEELL